ncbi:tRNA-dihydrouridine synthase 3 [Paragonimus westermani]|uniref:tRNA-dihydrouridine(47) synthase [NAD(P)(+)] n=1 Tax=Paragonimus westermani TaxID=34504 RepID=A0A5J4NUK1_9TREM|nr:tRNA-dihydrouridine synthase 3 [Paragonimus westermani]
MPSVEENVLSLDKSLVDYRSYRFVQLENGLRAIVISNLKPGEPIPEDSSSEEDDDEEEATDEGMIGSKAEAEVADVNQGPDEHCENQFTLIVSFKAFPEPNENSSGDALSTTTHGTCPYIADGCRYNHDLEKALAEKLPNLPGPCPVLVATGRCTVGKLCRWASGHILPEIPPPPIQPESVYLNCLSQENRTKLQKKQYCFRRADSITRALLSRSSTNCATQEEGIPSDMNDRAPLGHVTDEDEIRCRTSERKQVGNLPFRRVCKRLGAEITCGEMAIATQLLQGKQSEWALLRRHSSEDMFGVQLCGAHVDTMTRAAQLIEENCEVDFVDINCGCPIDIIWKKGAGAGLLQHGNRLESIVRGVNGVLERAQVTVKLRTGIREKKNTAHQLIPSLQSAGAALITVRAR